MLRRKLRYIRLLQNLKTTQHYIHHKYLGNGIHNPGLVEDLRNRKILAYEVKKLTT